MTDNPADNELDVTGLLCPLPVLRARKRLQALPSGSVLKVVATDPMSMIDMPHFCAEQGHTLLSQEMHETKYHFRIKRS